MNWSQVDLDVALGRLAEGIEWPPAPDLVDRVQARTGEGAVVRQEWRRRVALVAAAVVLGVFGALLSSPGFREAAADFLGIGRIRIGTVENVPTPTTTAPDLELGRESTLDELDAFFGHVEVPAVLGTPDTVYISDFHEFSALVYDASTELPEIGETGAGVIVFRLPDFPVSAYFEKTLGPGTELRPVRVNGVEAFWTRGAEHALTYQGSTRVSGNALIWQEGRVTFRIESMLSLSGVKDIASSLE